MGVAWVMTQHILEKTIDKLFQKVMLKNIFSITHFAF